VLACKPGSVGNQTDSLTVISLGVQSPVLSSSLPAASWSRRGASRRLLGLAPAGVCRATDVTTGAVGSYPTFSPLPTARRHRWRSVFCGTFHRGGYPRPGVTWQPAPWSPDFPRVFSITALHSRPSGQHLLDTCNITASQSQTGAKKWCVLVPIRTLTG